MLAQGGKGAPWRTLQRLGQGSKTWGSKWGGERSTLGGGVWGGGGALGGGGHEKRWGGGGGGVGGCGGGGGGGCVGVERQKEGWSVGPPDFPMRREGNESLKMVLTVKGDKFLFLGEGDLLSFPAKNARQSRMKRARGRSSKLLQCSRSGQKTHAQGSSPSKSSKRPVDHLWVVQTPLIGPNSVTWMDRTRKRSRVEGSWGWSKTRF